MAQDLDALARKFGGQEVSVAISSNPNAQPPADIEFDQVAKQFGGTPDDLSQVGQRVPLEPNTVGTFARHVGAQLNPVPVGQVLPFPKALGGGGWDAPIQAVSGILQAQGDVKAAGDKAWKRGDHVEAVGHYLNWLVPLLGPILDQAGTHLRQGEYAAGAGDIVGVGGAIAAPELLGKAKQFINPQRIAARAENAAGEAVAGELAPSGSSREIRTLGKQAKAIAPDVLRGTTRSTPAAFRAQIATHLDDASAVLDADYAALPKTGYSTTPLANRLQRSIDALKVQGSGGSVVSSAVQPQVEALEQALKEVKALGPYTNTENLAKLRNQWKDHAKASFVPEINPNAVTSRASSKGWADAWGDLQDTITDRHPQLKPHNADYRIWKQANDVVDALEDRERVRPTVGRSIMAGAMGATVGAAMGGVEGSAIGSIIAPLVERGLVNQVGPTMKIAMARQLQKLADAIRSGNQTRAVSIAQSLRPMILTATAGRAATPVAPTLQPATP